LLKYAAKISVFWVDFRCIWIFMRWNRRRNSYWTGMASYSDIVICERHSTMPVRHLEKVESHFLVKYISDEKLQVRTKGFFKTNETNVCRSFINNSNIYYIKLVLKWHDYYYFYYYYYYFSYSEYSFIKCSKLHVVYTESSLKCESFIYYLLVFYDR